MAEVHGGMEMTVGEQGGVGLHEGNLLGMVPPGGLASVVLRTGTSPGGASSFTRVRYLTTIAGSVGAIEPPFWALAPVPMRTTICLVGFIVCGSTVSVTSQ